MTKSSLLKARQVEELDAGRGELTDLLKRLRGEVIRDPEQSTRVILQTIKAVTENLPSRVPGHEYIMLVGLTGSGKSTLANWLVGQDLSVSMERDVDGDSVPIIDCPVEVHKVGRDDTQSQTFLPQVTHLGGGRHLIDFPGFLDSAGDEVRIGMDLAFRKWVNALSPVRVLMLVPVALIEGKGSLVAQQLGKMARLLPLLGSPVSQTESASLETCSTWVVGITKCDETFTVTPAKKYRQATQFIEKFNPEILVRNINWSLFPLTAPKGQGLGREEFINDLIARARTPNVPLHSDCLCSQDVKNFAVNFANFSDTMWHRIAEEISGQGGVLEPDLQEVVASFERTINESTSKFRTWEALLDLSQKRLARLNALTDYISKRSQEMVTEQILISEKESQPIFATREWKQCRIKECLVQVEDKLLDSLSPALDKWQELILKTVQNLHEAKFITQSDFDQFMSVFRTERDKMDEEARRLGYENMQALTSRSQWLRGSAFAGGAVGVVGLGAALWHGTTFAAWWSGAVATLGGTAATVITGGVLIGGAALAAMGWAIYKLAQHWGDEYSDKLVKLYTDAICAVGKAFSATCQHRTRLIALLKECQHGMVEDRKAEEPQEPADQTAGTPAAA